MMLLHPADVLKAKELVSRTSQCDSHQQVEAANFMTSKKLDEYCCNGKYYISAEVSASFVALLLNDCP
jgi:hypothetical protein